MRISGEETSRNLRAYPRRSPRSVFKENDPENEKLKTLSSGLTVERDGRSYKTSV